ncbi:MAG TPA: repressor LexA, partial [Gammaproteobacteria bacterium]|nr:repressor LexA [Gammaproteobacteria bacterium]
MEQLTRRQQEIFNLIRNTVEKTGLPPTRVEIADAFGF